MLEIAQSDRHIILNINYNKNDNRFHFYDTPECNPNIGFFHFQFSGYIYYTDTNTWCAYRFGKQLQISPHSWYYSADYRQIYIINRTLVSNITLFRMLRCSWNNACLRCSNYIFIIESTLGFNILRKYNCMTRRETVKFWDVVCLKIDIWRYLWLVTLAVTALCMKDYRSVGEG